MAPGRHLSISVEIDVYNQVPVLTQLKVLKLIKQFLRNVLNIFWLEIGLPRGNLPVNAGRHKRPEFDPWVGKISRRRKWQPTPVFSPVESHGQRSLAGYRLWGHKELDVTGEGNGTPLQYSCLENPMDRGAWWAAVHGVAKSWTRLSDFTFIFYFHALEKEMATHSSVLAWRIPGTGEPGGLPSMRLHRVGHN